MNSAKVLVCSSTWYS